MIKSVAIIGNGKVGTYMARAFRRKGIKVQVYARSPKSKTELNLSELDQDSDLCLICVADRNVAKVSTKIPAQHGILAHSSGTIALEDLDSKHEKRGIFYPLMSIAENSQVDLMEIPFCLEATDDSVLQDLEDWAETLSLKHYRVPSHQRKRLHLAAVIGHNFSNLLYHWAYLELKKSDLPLAILKPLLKQQVAGLESEDPIMHQTGPAVRGDFNTIEAHLKMLENPELADLYSKISELIQKEYEEKL